MDETSSGMQGIFGLLMVAGGIVLVALVLADLGGFTQPGSTPSTNTPAGNTPGAIVANPWICRIWPSYPFCVGNGTDPATQCTMNGGIWDGTKCTPPKIAPGK